MTSIIFAVAVMVLLSGAQFYKAAKIVQLKKRCTVIVPAVCRYIDREKRGKMTYSRARYTFEYMGQTYNANSAVWTRSAASRVRVGDRVEVGIDPDCLYDGVLDQDTRTEMTHSVLIGLLLLGWLMPLAAIRIYPEVAHFLGTIFR